MSGTLKIFFITAVILLAYDISVTGSISTVYTKNQTYKATGGLMNCFQIADLETETETQGIIRNTPAVILTTLTFNHFFLKANQNNLLTHHHIFSSRSVFIIQHKLII
jgi:hypothetical protein